MFRQKLFCVGMALALVSCGSGRTSVRLEVRYDDAWDLFELEVSAAGRSANVQPAHELLLLVRDERVGEPLRVEVRGLRAGAHIAFGRVDVQPIPGTELRATVTLSRLACGAWCTEGASACDGDGIVVCERQEDGCMRWGTREPCAIASPFCSLGVCNAECIDECAEGDRRCAGPGGTQACGQRDSDPCLDWLPMEVCTEGEQCENGRCAIGCAGECGLGAARCQDGAISTCADRDFDGCAEWGPSEPCPTEQSCELGACVPIERCTDQCAADACDGLTLTQCGNYDLDPCLEPSPGLSCVPADVCLEGSCTTSGCQSRAHICDEPPASHCLDASTLRVYENAGVCTAGACDYPYRDQACPSCPACDACEGVTCQSPPATSCIDGTTLRTYEASGVCIEGACSYGYTDDACPFGCAAAACNACVSAWTSYPIEVAGGPPVGHDTSLAVDASGGLHIAFDDYDDRVLRYAYRTPAGTWTTSTVDPSRTGNYYGSLAVDASGRVHVAYFDSTDWDLRYAYRDPGSSWSIWTVDSTGFTGLDPALAVDSSGGVHVSYRESGTNRVLRYAYRSPAGTWTLTTVDPEADSAADTALAVDGSGVHVAYAGTGGDLRYAYRSPGGTWTTTSVDSSTTTGYASLALDASGAVHISYYDNGNGDLRYARRAPAGSWTVTTVDATGTTGRYTSIAVNAAGGVHVSYQDATNAQLRYAYRNTAGVWTTAVADPAGGSGHDSSLALDAMGGVHVSHRDLTNLRYAYLPPCP